MGKAMSHKGRGLEAGPFLLTTPPLQCSPQVFCSPRSMTLTFHSEFLSQLCSLVCWVHESCSDCPEPGWAQVS